MGGVVHHGVARDRLREGVAEGAEAIDDPRLAGQHRGRARRNVLVHTGETRRQHIAGKRVPGRIPRGDRLQGVERAGLDDDPHRHEGTGTGPFRRSGGGGNIGFARQRHAVDADAHGPLIIAVPRQHVGEAPLIGLGAADQTLAVRRRVLA